MDCKIVIAAGMLEAEGTPLDAPASDLASRLADIAAGPTLWATRPYRDLAEYQQRVTQRVARWRPPTIVVPDSSEISAFFAAAGDDDVRLEVSNFADWSLVTSQQRPRGIVSAYIRRRALDDWRWRWPLRLGVLNSPLATRWVSEAQGSGHYRKLYSVSETDGSAECEILFVTPDQLGGSFRSAAVVVVMNVEPKTLTPEALDAAMQLGPAGVTLCPGDSLAWVEHLVVELSHDSPLDLALAKAAPQAVLAADPEFVARNTVRQWGMGLSVALHSQGNEADAAALERALLGQYAHEGGEATETTVLGEIARTAGIEADIQGGPPRMAAMAPRPPAAPPAPAKGIKKSRPRPDIAPPDARRLQAIVGYAPKPGAKKKVTDRFVAGAEHNIKVCIAARLIAGATRTDAEFRSPTPGRAVTLDVSIIAGGKRTKRTLELPPTADSKWTAPVRFDVPAKPAKFAVYIEVAYNKRVIQSATLKGAPFELSIDVSEPAATADERAAVQAGITIVDGPKGTPTVIDLDDAAGGIGEQDIKKANDALRKELFAAFVNPPASLADAAGALTKLAVRGRILYERLAGGASTYHDDADWIHVNAFARSDVLIELAYTHPMPANDTLVPVCPEALAGATSCGKDCHHRNSAEVVCPFGFWATSKVIERRRHVHDRANNTPGALRKLSPTRSSVVGVSLKADEADTTSSARIIKALGKAVAAASVVKSWKELETAAARHPGLFVLVTHTIEPEDGDDLGTSLELNGDLRPIHRINDAAINPGRQQPGPIVLALGCDTNTLTAGYTDLVVNLHNARAEVVLSALSPIPGKGVADFLERFMPLLKATLVVPGQHRFGSVMLAARRATIVKGDLMALALSATGDADVELTS